MNVTAGRSTVDALLQVCYAVAIGFAAFVLRTGILWPLVPAHFLIDPANPLLTPGTIPTPALSLVITALFVGYGLYLTLQKGEEQLLS